MARAPFQCLIIPYRIINDVPEYAVFKREDMSIWQFLSGGGEDQETPLEAAKRECYEEAEIPKDTVFYKLDTLSSISANIFPEKHRCNWGQNCYVIREYTFAFQLKEDIIRISHEHSEYKWVPYEEALSLLKYDSNKTALTELNERIHDNYFVEA